jgi:hypothetical protein
VGLAAGAERRDRCGVAGDGAAAEADPQRPDDEIGRTLLRWIQQRQLLVDLDDLVAVLPDLVRVRATRDPDSSSIARMPLM